MGFVERLRGGKGGSPVFAPCMTRLAARLEQVDPDRLQEDAGALARALHAAQRLLGLEAIVLDATGALTTACRSLAEGPGAWWRTLEPEELPRHPRFSLAVDAVGRLRAAVPADTGLFVLLPGPWALAEVLGGGSPTLADAIETAGDACACAVRALAEARVAALMVAEGDPPDSVLDEAAAAVRSMCTTARYYGVASAVCLADGGAAGGPLGDGTAADVVVIPAESRGPGIAERCGRGLALPGAWFAAPDLAAAGNVRGALAAWPGARLVTTAGEVPEGSLPETMREMLRVVRGGAA